MSQHKLVIAEKPSVAQSIAAVLGASTRRDLKPGREYDGLHQAALCRARADWLVGINATRLFSVLYHRTLNVGRVISPTLALIVQREAEIDAFKPEPFYTVNLSCGVDTVSEKFKDKSETEHIATACKGQVATIKTVERKEKSEKAPALYDLTTLQRDANRLLGYTAQQTLDYLQALYEKKLCTYPRTDARFLTDDMESAVPALAAVAAAICEVPAPGNVNSAQVCNSKKVSDHHAVVPTASAANADISVLPIGEREIMRLVARQLLCAVSDAHKYAETVVTIECGGYSFAAKGKTVLTPGWKAYIQSEQTDKALPDMTEGDTTPVTDVTVKEGKTTPPKHFTEDTLLSAMETAGAKEAPDDAERKGLGTPATRAAILEAMNAYGYTDADMLPLSRERAIELFQRDVAVYMLYEDNTEAMAFDTDEIITFEGMLGVTAADWELAPADLKVQQDVEQAFLNNPADCFAIYQLKPGEDTRYLRFESLAAVTAAGQAVERKNYEPVYTDSFTKFEGTRDRLEDLFDRFNNNRPADFHGHSLSVSDIIALKQNGQVSYHYVDSFDFAPLPDFKKPENYLKNAEMAMEDDYGMIDGIVNNGVKQPTVAELEQQAKSGHPISLMDLAAASHRERAADRKDKRPSVLEQLKSYQEKGKPNAAPKRSAEREL